MKFIKIFIILLLISQPASAYLKIHPENPHYFQDAITGSPIIIASDSGIVPTSRSINNNNLINRMIDRKIIYGRVWHFLPWGRDNSIWPWGRSNVPDAPMGSNKIDMNKWNPAYWNRMKAALAKCNKAGIYSEIHLFDRCGMSPASETRWHGNPWASDNNINNLETPDSLNDGTPEFYQYASRPNLRYQQERYVKKMVDETIKYDIVIYEIENEHWEDNSPDFANHYGKFVKEYIAAKYPGHPRLISYSSLKEDLEALYDSPYIDIINKHFGNEAEENPDLLNQYIEPRWKRNKPINIDEFANGLKDTDTLRRMCWTIIASGGNFHIEDVDPQADYQSVVENIRQFMIKSKWDFIHSAPDRSLVKLGGGYCMVQPGKEYIFYFPSGGKKTVNLKSADKYHARWWNTKTNKFSRNFIFSHKDGLKSFTTPASGDWVLQIFSD